MSENKHTKYDLIQMQSLPLEAKIRMTNARIKEWYEHWDGQVYVSFSGGKDSTVLLDLVRKLYPDVEAVFVNTGLEFPEIQKFVKSFSNVTILYPKMRFDEVIKTYGYPVISKEVSECIFYGRQVLKYHKKYKLGTTLQKLEGTLLDKNGERSMFNKAKWKPLLDVDFDSSHYCCQVMKKSPVHIFATKSKKKPITGQTASESHLREQQWLKNGCNGFDMKRPISNPLSFWTEQDILHYIYNNKLPIASIYGEVVLANNADQIRLVDDVANEELTTTGCKRSGCIFCGFGCQLEKSPTRFQLLKETHPRQYDYCMNGGGYDDNGVWKPTKEGLGLKHIFDELNKIYGKDFIKYE